MSSCKYCGKHATTAICPHCKSKKLNHCKYFEQKEDKDKIIPVPWCNMYNIRVSKPTKKGDKINKWICDNCPDREDINLCMTSK